jgi:hypothetical protein
MRIIHVLIKAKQNLTIHFCTYPQGLNVSLACVFRVVLFVECVAVFFLGFGVSNLLRRAQMNFGLFDSLTKILNSNKIVNTSLTPILVQRGKHSFKPTFATSGSCCASIISWRRFSSRLQSVSHRRGASCCASFLHSSSLAVECKYLGENKFQ